MKYLFTILSLFLITSYSLAQQNPFYVGHSLVNFDMPTMVNGLALSASKTTNYGQQIINGSPLQYNYNNASSAQGTSFFDAFPAGNYNKLIVTEAIPLQNHLTYSNTYVVANNFYTYAKNNNNNNPIKFYIYETWNCINSGIPQPNEPTGCAYDNSQNSTLLWYPRLQADFSLWTGIVNYVRTQNPNDSQIWMIPAGQAFYNLTTMINAGSVPGITNVNQLFQDDIHLNNMGNYFIACVMYACIFEESPQGLTTSLNNQWTVPFTNMPTTAQATIMQQVAWNTLTSLSSWTGIQSLSTSDFNLNKPVISFYVKEDNLSINFKESKVRNIEIFNQLGQKVLSKNVNDKLVNIEVSSLSKGIYFIKSNQENIGKFIK